MRLQRTKATAVAAFEIYGGNTGFVLFCLHLTNAHSRESMQLCENNNMHTLRDTEDMPEKMPVVCQKTLKRQRSGHALTQRPVNSLTDGCLAFNILSLAGWLFCILK